MRSPVPSRWLSAALVGFAVALVPTAAAATTPADSSVTFALRASGAPVVVIDGKLFADPTGTREPATFQFATVATGTQLRSPDTGQAVCPGANDQLQLCPVGNAKTVWDVSRSEANGGREPGVALRLQGTPQFAGRALVEDRSLLPKPIVLRGPVMPGQLFELRAAD
ncbi:hypothetical protein SKPI104516_05975 [Skermania piniformis]